MTTVIITHCCMSPHRTANYKVSSAVFGSYNEALLDDSMTPIHLKVDCF